MYYVKLRLVDITVIENNLQCWRMHFILSFMIWFI